MLLLTILVLAAGCTSVRETDPPRTATEQLLISKAVDDALARLRLGIPAGTKVWVDTANFEGRDAKYAIGAIRDRILQEGALLTATQTEADAVVEIRSGALSVNADKTLLGLPSLPVPVPLVGVMQTPELALFSRNADTGVAKLGFTIIDAKSGSLAPYSPQDPAYGFSKNIRWSILLLIGWTESDLLPEREPAAAGEELSAPADP